MVVSLCWTIVGDNYVFYLRVLGWKIQRNAACNMIPRFHVAIESDRYVQYRHNHHASIQYASQARKVFWCSHFVFNW